MRWSVAAVAACVVAISGVGVSSHTNIVRASDAHTNPVPLESLPISNSSQVSVLSPDSPMHYRGDALTHGVGLDTSPTEAHADFKLAGKFDRLSGTVYADDQECGSGGPLTISDSSDPAHLKLLFTVTLPPTTKQDFSIPVRGVTYLTLHLSSGNGCYGDTSVVAVVATLTTGTANRQAPTSVVMRYPTNNAGEPANSKVLFGWQPFPHATNYALHIWLVGLAGSATLTAKTPFSFATSVYHKTSYTWNDHGFLPGTYQYSLLPLDDKGHNLAGWSTPTQITLAS